MTLDFDANLLKSMELKQLNSSAKTTDETLQVEGTASTAANVIPIAEGKPKLKNKELKALLEQFGENSDKQTRKSISNAELVNGKLSITYKDNNSKKIINPDLSFETVNTQLNEDTGIEEEITKSYSNQQTLLKEKISSKNFSIETFFDDNNRKYKTVQNDNEQGSITTILFNEAEEPEAKEIRKGSNVMTYDFLGENHTERITSKVTNQGLPIEEKQNFTYMDDGQVKIETYTASEQQNNNVSNNNEYELQKYSSTTNLSNNNQSTLQMQSASADQDNKTQKSTVQYCSADNINHDGTIKDNNKLSDKPIQNNNSEVQKYSASSETEVQQQKTTGDEKQPVDIQEQKSNNEQQAIESKPTDTQAIQNDKIAPQSKNQQQETEAEQQTKVDEQSSQAKVPEKQPKVDNQSQIAEPQPKSDKQPVRVQAGEEQTKIGSQAQQPNSVKPQPQPDTKSIRPQDSKPQQKADIQSAQPQYNKSQPKVDIKPAQSQTEEPQSKVNSPQPNIIAEDYQNKASQADNKDIQTVKAQVKQEAKEAVQQLEGFIKSYAKEYKLSENQVRTLIGLNTSIDIIKIVENISNNTSVNTSDLASAINELKQVVNSNTPDFNKIKNAVLNIAKLNTTPVKHENAKAYGDNNYIQISEPKEAKFDNIPQIAKDLGINAAELSDKLAQLPSGESFIIKPHKLSANIDDNIQLKIENRNGKIYVTEIKLNSEPVISDPIPDEIKTELMALLPPDLKLKLANCKTKDEYLQIISEVNEIEARDNKNIKLTNTDITTPSKQTKIIYRNGTFFRVPAGHPLITEQNSVEEIHLDVNADRRLLEELDELISKGTYKNRNGERILLTNNKTNLSYATPKDTQNWEFEVSPIKIYSDAKINEETEAAIMEIAKRYSRKTETEKRYNVERLSSSPQIIQENIQKEERLKQILASIGIPDIQAATFIASIISTTDYYKKLNKYDDTNNSDMVSDAINDDIDI